MNDDRLGYINKLFSKAEVLTHPRRSSRLRLFNTCKAVHLDESSNQIVNILIREQLMAVILPNNERTIKFPGLRIVCDPRRKLTILERKREQLMQIRG